MKSLVKIMLIIALCFASTFILIRVSGVLSIDQIKAWLTNLHALSTVYVGAIVILLLVADIFIFVPTLTVIILSGYFLGFTNGAIASITGLLLAGSAGYIVGRLFGPKVFQFLLRSSREREEARDAFLAHGFIMIILSRAMPILPEVSACLAGMTQMRYARFLTAWLLSTVPYVLIASYSGSISSLEKPGPAIFAMIALSGSLWLAWYVFRRKPFGRNG